MVYAIVLVAFVALSQIVISWSDQGSWLYLAMACLLFSRWKDGTLVEQIFSRNSRHLLAFFEVCIFSIPCVLMLLFNDYYLESILFVPAVYGAALLNFPGQFSPVIPTPFYARPFEFIIGFRKWFFLLIGLYCIVIISIVYGNLNLGIVTLIALYLSISSYYGDAEPTFMLWMYSYNSTSFLLHKVATTLLYTFASVLPASVLLVTAFPSDWLLIGGISLFGVLVPITSLLNKYVSFPKQVELINVVFIGFCIVFPPISLLIIPYLANKASENLKQFL